jgi:hypothetical protein
LFFKKNDFNHDKFCAKAGFMSCASPFDIPQRNTQATSA